MQPVESLDITNEYIKSFFTKKTYLENDDPKLFKKIVEYLTWVKQPKGGKSPTDGTTEDTINPLLGKKSNQNEHKIVEGDKFIRKLNNQIEMDEDSGHSDDQVLCAGDLENIPDDKKDHENLQIMVEVHNIDSD